MIKPIFASTFSNWGGTNSSQFEFDNSDDLYKKLPILIDKIIVKNENSIMLQSFLTKYWFVFGNVTNYSMDNFNVPEFNPNIYDKDIEHVIPDKVEEWILDCDLISNAYPILLNKTELMSRIQMSYQESWNRKHCYVPKKIESIQIVNGKGEVIYDIM